ncbi:DoxX family membrane protein [Microbispora sp. NPDC049125]|uniref:DoxX family protein n=1 Tax=Microbispora sp. NPDC049125 TaxID=3154929 RepID=UPI00346572A6
MKRTLHDIASLAARMGVGGIFFANGWQKLEAGLTATSAQFSELHAPMPGVWSAATMLIELVGGTLLIAGLAVPAVGLLLFIEALAVFVLTAGDPGLPLTGGAIELIVALGAASVLLAVVGGGRISVDHMVVIKRREAEAAGEFAAEAEAADVIAALREGRLPDRPAAAGERPPGSGAQPASPKPAKPAGSGTTASESTGSGATASDSTGSAPSAAGPVTFPAAKGDAGPEAPTAPSPRPRRTKRGESETTESRAEAPARAAGQGDTLVAGRRPPAKRD